MTSAIHRLTPNTIKANPKGKLNDGGGLYLYRLKTGDQWVFRFTVNSKRREMGLGGYPAVTLADARKLAVAYRAIVAAGQNPIDIRKAEKAARAAIEGNASKRSTRLLSAIAPEAFEARKPQLRGDGKAGRWYSPIKTHVLPVLGGTPVDEIDGNAIAKALRPIWHNKPDVARKAITRLNACLSFARAKGIDVDRHAVSDAREILGKQVHRSEHIPAMDWRDVPHFYSSLEGGGTVQLALQLLILTGLRSKPIRFARMDQIADDVLTVPAELVKGMKGQTDDFLVPLTSEALRVIERAERFAREGDLFPGVRTGVISDASMSRHMERAGLNARPHGFRSSFRTWADEATNASFEVKETAIGHKVGSKVSRAYSRSDYLDERRTLAERWAEHVTGKRGSVVPIRNERK